MTRLAHAVAPGAHLGATTHPLVTRRAGLVALVVECPAVAGGYLAKQFYKRDWSISHRAEVLEVIVVLAHYSPAYTLCPSDVR